MSATIIGSVRSTDLASKRGTAAVYAERGSARVLIGTAMLLLALRTAIGGFGRGDVIVVGATLVIAGPVEWAIHRFLLHADPASWTSRTLGTGTGHREHHLDPPDVDWLMLRAVDAGVFVVSFGAVTAAWAIPVMWVTGSAIVGPFVAAWALAAIGLAHYEWVHLLVHTRYRCHTRYYARLQRNHRLHHFRNERYWLGVTTNCGDRLLGTYPANRSAVPLSDTARTLDTCVGARPTESSGRQE